MRRRAFLSMLAGVPVGAVLAVDPLARTIFLPPRGGWPLHGATQLDKILANSLYGKFVGSDAIWAPLYDFEPFQRSLDFSRSLT